MNINDKINLKSNAILYFTYPQYRQMIDNNKLALAPYYMDKLNKQGNYVAQQEFTPDWAKKIQGYLHQIIIKHEIK